MARSRHSPALLRSVSRTQSDGLVEIHTGTPNSNIIPLLSGGEWLGVSPQPTCQGIIVICP